MNPSLEIIAEQVSKHTQMSIYAMRSKNRETQIVYARHMVFYLACKLTKLSLKRIGKDFCRHHSTVIHGRKCVNTWLEMPEQYKQNVKIVKVLEVLCDSILQHKAPIDIDSPINEYVLSITSLATFAEDLIRNNNFRYSI